MAKLKAKQITQKKTKKSTSTKKNCATRLEKWIITAINEVAKENDTTAVAFVREAIVQELNLESPDHEE